MSALNKLEALGIVTTTSRARNVDVTPTLPRERERREGETTPASEKISEVENQERALTIINPLPPSDVERAEARFHPEASRFIDGLKVMGVESGLRSNLGAIIKRFQEYDRFKEWANSALTSADKKTFNSPGDRVRYLTVATLKEIGAR